MRDRGAARFGAGVLIGAAGIAPGVSGCVVALSLGVYRPAIDALAHMRRQSRESAAYLAPLVMGCGVGMALAGYVLMAFMVMFAVEALYLFAGLVLGSLPGLVRAGGGWRLRCVPALALGAVAYWVLSRLLPTAPELARLDAPAALGCGAVLALGTVVPGVSSSFLLLRCGMYRAYLSALGQARLSELALIALGFVLMAAALVRVVSLIMERYPATAQLAIAGFTFMSVLDAMPPISTALSPTACMLLLPLGAGVGLLMRGESQSAVNA